MFVPVPLSHGNVEIFFVCRWQNTKTKKQQQKTHITIIYTNVTTGVFENLTQKDNSASSADDCTIIADCKIDLS